jgi:hypothetical protein
MTTADDTPSFDSPASGGQPPLPPPGAAGEPGGSVPPPGPGGDAPVLGASEARAVVSDTGSAGSSFTPLRTEPPPKLFATWWLRYMLLASQLVGIVAVLATEYARGPIDLYREPVVVVPYVLAAVLLVAWSGLAMVDAGRLVPATTYQRRSSGLVAMMLWLAAFAAPVGAYFVVDWARTRFSEDADDLVVAVIAVVAVMVCFFVVWLPFSYHTRQAHRIGAPARVVAGWFWLPLVTLVGALLINVAGLDEALGEDGFDDVERTIQLAVVYGLPAFMFALTTWRSTTVFDEVIDLRWRRWRNEWKQTLDAMAAEPAPGPEAPVGPFPSA